LCGRFKNPIRLRNPAQSQETKNQPIRKEGDEHGPLKKESRRVEEKEEQLNGRNN